MSSRYPFRNPSRNDLIKQREERWVELIQTVSKNEIKVDDFQKELNSIEVDIHDFYNFAERGWQQIALSYLLDSESESKHMNDIVPHIEVLIGKYNELKPKQKDKLQYDDDDFFGWLDVAHEEGDLTLENRTILEKKWKNQPL